MVAQSQNSQPAGRSGSSLHGLFTAAKFSRLTGRTLRASRVVITGFLVSLFVLVGIVPASPPVQAAVGDACGTTQNNLVVTPNHAKNFYIDSGQGQNVDAGYASYTVKNLAATSQSNLWIQVGNFTGGALSLANPADSAMSLGSVAASGSGTGFFLLKASRSSTTAQSHVVRVFSGKPGLSGSTELYSCTYTFAKVSETIKALANKVTGVARVGTSAIVLGDKYVVQVTGNSGTIGAGNATDGSLLWFSPAGRSSWPTQALRLESTSVVIETDCTYLNRLSVTLTEIHNCKTSLKNTSKVSYAATYTFRIIGTTSAAVSPSPVAQIASGTQMKHNDQSALASTAGGLTSISITPTISLQATKSIAATTTVTGSDTDLHYTVNLANTGTIPVSVDQVLDTPGAGLTYVAGSAKFAGATIPNPGIDLGSGKLIFSGPLNVAANSTAALTYSMRITNCSLPSFSNSVVAQVGSIAIGSSPTTYQQLTASASCQAPAVTSTIAELKLPIVVTTGPVSALGTTTATITGTVDSNGNAGITNYFQWGTSASLTNATTLPLTSTTSSSDPVPYSANLTSLSPGQVYYYRIVSGDQYGQILSFVTSEPAALPTVVTTSVYGITVAPDNTHISATLGASIDPNLVANGVKVRFQWAVDSSGGSCTSLGTTVTAPSATGYLRELTDTTATADVVLAGSFPTDISLRVPDIDVTSNTSGVTGYDKGFTSGTRYCCRVAGYYNTAAADSSWTTGTELLGG